MNEQIRILDKEGFTLAINELVNLIKESKEQNVEADFLTESGFGNLRYYNGKLEYYNVTTQKWVETSVTPDNVMIINMMPNPMRFIMGIYDHDIGHYKLKWQEPEDTVVDGQVICVVEKVVIRRKLGSVPQNENDGDLVKTVERKDFGGQVNYWYTDISFTPNMNDTYYYKAFPISTMGFANASTQNEVSIKAKDHYLFGFKIDQNESDPMYMISYIEDNAKFRSAYMNYEQDKFHYGDWEDSWFIKGIKPCMLYYNGTVAYELDPNDYTKKKDGTNSDVANQNFQGNTMVGIPKVYWKIDNNGDDTANIYFSDKKVDEDFVCWSHIDNNGNEIPYCYMPAYNGSNVNNVLRSLSGFEPEEMKTETIEFAYVNANNKTKDKIWNTEVLSDWIMINMLLLLIGKSTNTQETYGVGNSISVTVNASGLMNSKGLFWGDMSGATGVKVFGIENWYGNISRYISGWINYYGTQKIKMTYGMQDGSNTNGYNFDGTGYIEIFNATPEGDSNGGYISKIKFTEYGVIPVYNFGSSTTYFCDAFWFDNEQIAHAIIGGDNTYGMANGIFTSLLNDGIADYYFNIGLSISCKPLAIGGES